MRLELEHFTIDGAYGWNQSWFPNWFMRLGGCAAVTACDSCVYFALRFGQRDLIPFDPMQLTRQNYLLLSDKVKPFLHPRLGGIDRLEIYQDGLARYFQSIRVSGPHADALHGDMSYDAAAEMLRQQIQARYPVPFLLLMHDAPEFKNFQWHWFLLMGFDDRPDKFLVKAVTYGVYRWLDFRKLWDTGKPKKGGMILFSVP